MKYIKNILVSNALFSIVILSLVFWHIWSLTLSPIVWFDEVFMASITNSLVHGKGFALELDKGQQIFIYGPIYFLLTGLSFILMDISIYSFRIVNLLFALLTLVIMYKVIQKYEVKRFYNRLIILMFLFDVIFNQNSHSGRMEFVAVFFTFCALYYQMFRVNSVRKYIVIALLGTTSFLITPRVAVVLFPVLLNTLYEIAKMRQWKSLLLFILIPVSAYLVWILYSHGSIDAFLKYYLSNQNGAEVSNFSRFFGGTFLVPKYQYLIMLGTLIVFIDLILQKELRKVIILFPPIVFYFLLVKTESALYTALILPFVYTILALGLDSFSRKLLVLNRSFKVFIYTSFLLNLAIFVFKSAVIISTSKDRDPKLLQTWVEMNLEKNSHVVGSECYYYACISNNNTLGLLYPDIYYTNQNMIPKYLFLNYNALEDVRIAQGLEEFKNHFDLKYLNTFSPSESDNKMLRIAKFLNVDFRSSYCGDLYEVNVKSEKSGIL